MKRNPNGKPKEEMKRGRVEIFKIENEAILESMFNSNICFSLLNNVLNRKKLWRCVLKQSRRES